MELTKRLGHFSLQGCFDLGPGQIDEQRCHLARDRQQTFANHRVFGFDLLADLVDADPLFLADLELVLALKTEEVLFAPYRFGGRQVRIVEVEIVRIRRTFAGMIWRLRPGVRVRFRFRR